MTDTIAGLGTSLLACAEPFETTTAKRTVDGEVDPTPSIVPVARNLQMIDGRERDVSRGPAEYWAIVVRRRWLVMLSLFFCWALAWTYSWLIPRSYRSEALILVEQQKVPEQYVVSNVTVSLQDRLQSMTQQILSRTRLQSTIDRFGLYAVKEGSNSTAQSDDAVEQMRKDIKIDLVESPARPGQLTAFKVYYTAGSPQLSRQINSELTSLFIEENLKLQQQLSESTTVFLQSQLAEARKKLEEQEAKVRTFKAEHFGDLPSQAETNVQILSGIQNQLLSTQRSLDGAKQQKLYLESLQQQYQSAQANIGGAETQSGNSAQGLATELTDLRRRLAEARTHLTEEHPDVMSLRDRIAKVEKLRGDMEREKVSRPEVGRSTAPIDPSVAAEVQRGATTPMMQVQSQLKAIELEVQNYTQHTKELESQIAAYRVRLNLTPQTEQQLADISRGYEESKANYNSLLQKQNQSQLATSLEERQQGEQFRVLDPPSLPSKPTAPNHLLLSLGGFAVGVVVGLALAALLESTNVLLRNQKDLEGIVEARVLVGIPHLKTSGEERTQKYFRWAEVGIALVMTLVIAAGNLYAFFKG
jgi:polysaccharide biosynthesis transport protein